jgi:hypothetical protein
VHSIQVKREGDLFSAPLTVPFHLMKAASTLPQTTGPETSMKIRLDTKQLATGNYAFLIAQSDDNVHEVPFRVLQKPPSIAGTPILLNTGSAAQSVLLHGSGLDRIESLSANGAAITLDNPGSGESRGATVTLAPEVNAGAVLSVLMKVTGFEEPISVPDALIVAGQKPVITTVRESSAGADSGIALNRGEMALNSLVSFEIGTRNASTVSAINLACRDAAGTPRLRIAMGETKPDAKLARESVDTVFLLFATQNAGTAG